MAIIKAARNGASLKRIIDYVTKDEKTNERLIAGINCDTKNAYDDMMLTKELYNKTGGRQYKHFIYSFPPGEPVTAEQVRDNAIKLFSETDALRGYQMLVAVHEDRKHLHAHVIVNSVRPSDGYKLQWSKADLTDLKSRCNELSREQGLSVPEKGKSQNITTWSMDKHKAIEKSLSGKYKSYYIDIANEIVACQKDATSKDDFINRMADKGITVNWSDRRKHITFVDASGHKVRDSNFEKTLKIQCSKEYFTKVFEQHKQEQQLAAKPKKKPRSRGLLGKLAAWRQERNETKRIRALGIVEEVAEVKRQHEISRIRAAKSRNGTTRVDSKTQSTERQVETRERGAEKQTQQSQHRHYLTRQNSTKQEQKNRGHGRGR